jgi:hypothetical protein
VRCFFEAEPVQAAQLIGLLQRRRKLGYGLHDMPAQFRITTMVFRTRSGICQQL